MNRRFFLNLSILGSFASILPLSPFDLLTETTINKEELLGKKTPQLFGNGYQLREAAYLHFVKMQKAALEDGIRIQIVSSYRSYNHQRQIWNRKYKRYTKRGFSPLQTINKIIEYSTIPGTSRHHWGTDIDIIDANAQLPSSLLQPKNYEENGAFSALKKWMELHAKDFNFDLVYTNNTNRKGFKYEPWHYTYTPLAIPYLEQFKTLELKKILLSDDLILGKEHFSNEFIQKYINENVLAIKPSLLSLNNR